MATEEKNPKSLINKPNINANKADEVKKMQRQETVDKLGDNEPRADGYLREEGVKSKAEGSAAERNVSAHSQEGREDYKRAKGAESRDSDQPYEDVITPESYDESVGGKVNDTEADQSGL